MPNWLIAIISVMSIFTIFGYIQYKSDDNSGYFGNAFGVRAMFFFIALGMIISIVIVITKFLL